MVQAQPEASGKMGQGRTEEVTDIRRERHAKEAEALLAALRLIWGRIAGTVVSGPKTRMVEVDDPAPDLRLDPPGSGSNTVAYGEPAKFRRACRCALRFFI